MKIAYIAGKYSGKDYNEIDDNIRIAERCAVELANRGIAFFCPHLNSAHFECKSTATPEFWYALDNEILKHCDAILMLPNWEQSMGAVKESLYCLANGIPIFYNVRELEDWYKQ